MLELRPTCEHCNKALPPDSLEARICSYECTFCASCTRGSRLRSGRSRPKSGSDLAGAGLAVT